MINFTTPVTINVVVNGTPVTTTVNRLSPTAHVDEYDLLWVLDNDGAEQVTSNGVAIITTETLAALVAADQPQE